ncbi:hypothetical protein [Myceligenerans pegani]|uniref:Uncharacterized protein n=1 Tax=Myceligenerans pegani TaxID=2776917 RepID=A0ABR9MZE7_9MICO|nr:hypothetical protein [Myceligenerans sp. TRM 65318]MBE1876279.1 hypothetical protein [Myceligenerans sp. TRM 65318]MBE3018550.1 hypothetical protein [Myceligenerans sp. TRM 65318]
MTELVLVILLLLFMLQGLAKFLLWAVVPYETRIKRIAAMYARGPGPMSVFDTVNTALAGVLVVLLFLTDMQHLSFLTGLIAGMVLIQISFHRFNQELPDDKAPRMPAPPITLMSYAIQARPSRAWLEYSLITALFVWGIAVLVSRNLFG